MVVADDEQRHQARPAPDERRREEEEHRHGFSDGRGGHAPEQRRAAQGVVHGGARPHPEPDADGNADDADDASSRAHDHTDAKPERRLYIAAQQCRSRADTAQHRSSSDTAEPAHADSANAWSRPRRVIRCARELAACGALFFVTPDYVRSPDLWRLLRAGTTKFKFPASWGRRLGA